MLNNGLWCLIEQGCHRSHQVTSSECLQVPRSLKARCAIALNVAVPCALCRYCDRRLVPVCSARSKPGPGGGPRLRWNNAGGARLVELHGLLVGGSAAADCTSNSLNRGGTKRCFCFGGEVVTSRCFHRKAVLSCTAGCPPPPTPTPCPWWHGLPNPPVHGLHQQLLCGLKVRSVRQHQQ
jgi:hypothetical protein